MHSQTDLQFPSRLARFIHQAAGVLVFGFVCWHLFFLAVRNFARDENQAISMFCDKIRVKPALDLANKWTGTYESVLGLDQGWVMFSSPVARSGGPFPSVRIEFEDGSSAELLSDNEPPDINRFVRFGLWRTRKFEHMIVTKFEDRKDSYRLPMWERYVCWRLEVWQTRNPDDPRKPVRIVLTKRRFAYPKPDEDPSNLQPPTIEEIATFDTEGKLVQ
jgi:hypothetical protein